MGAGFVSSRRVAQQPDEPAGKRILPDGYGPRPSSLRHAATEEARMNMGGGLTVGGVVMALVFLSAIPAFSDPSVEQLNTAVKACVEVTRRGENPGQTWHFDAY